MTTFYQQKQSPPRGGQRHAGITWRGGNCEIGRILHLKSEISKFRIGPRTWASNLRSRISDLRCRIRPISKFRRIGVRLVGYALFMPDNSFDVVSIVDMPEVLNAVQQSRKEIQTRFDLKDSKSQIELNE